MIRNSIQLPGDIKRILLLTPESAPARFAAGELQKYIHLALGVRLPISFEREEAVDRSVAQAVSTMPESLVEGAFLLSVSGEDEDDGFELAVDPRRKAVAIIGRNSRSLLFGVYAFLKRFLGMRWLHPGKTGERWERRQSVALPAFRATEKALLKYRGFYVDTCAYSINQENITEVVDWLAKNFGNYLLVSTVFYDRIREPLVRALKTRGLLLEVGHHGFDRYVDSRKNFRKHPEWFSMVAGKRSAGKYSFNMVCDSQICSTNSQALDVYADGLKRQLDSNPAIDILGISPNDGFGWCECPKCRRLESTDMISPLREPGADFTRRLYVGSARYHRIVQEVARRLGDAYSSRRFMFWAYGSAVLPTPVVRDLPDNFMLTFALYERRYNRELRAARLEKPPEDINRRLLDILGQWRAAFRGEISIYEYYAKYGWFGLPKWIPDILRSDTRFLRQKGISGIMSMIETDSFPLYEPNYLAQLEMSWDRKVSAAEWLDDYAANFGPLASGVKSGMKSVIHMLKPYGSFLAPAYPRARTGWAVEQSRRLSGKFHALAASARRTRSARRSSSRQLEAWAENLELTRLRFILNGIYHELSQAVNEGRREDAVEILGKWTAARERFMRAYRELCGTGAVLGDPRWLKALAACRGEQELAAALTKSGPVASGVKPEQRVKKLRSLAV